MNADMAFDRRVKSIAVSTELRTISVYQAWCVDCQVSYIHIYVTKTKLNLHKASSVNMFQIQIFNANLHFTQVAVNHTINICNCLWFSSKIKMGDKMS